jgi:hypothetical protein
MAKNRSIEQKIRKMKRRNRHAVFSGSTSKFAVRVGPTPFTEDVYGNTTTHETKMVVVGPVSLSKAVISTGRGPDAVRMQEYYQRIHSYDEALPKTLGFTGIDTSQRVIKVGLHGKRTQGDPNELIKKYQEIIRDTPKEMRINLVNDHLARLDLFFNYQQWFFVEIEYQKNFIRRSCIYRSREMAMTMLKMSKITWVETI